MSEINLKMILHQLEYKPKKMPFSWVQGDSDLYIYLPPYQKKAKRDSKRIKRLK